MYIFNIFFKVLSENLLEGVSSHLEDLDLANTSLTLLPTLNLPQLIRLVEYPPGPSQHLPRPPHHLKPPSAY